MQNYFQGRGGGGERGGVRLPKNQLVCETIFQLTQSEIITGERQCRWRRLSASFPGPRTIEANVPDSGASAVASSIMPSFLKRISNRSH